MNKADTLRAAIKASGYSARRVTVRLDNNTLRVTIRDAAVSIAAVKAIAASFENIDRCQATGEILLGGNTFIDVNYVDSVVAPVAAQVQEILNAAALDGFWVEIPGGFSADRSGERWTMRGPGFSLHNNTAIGTRWAAERIAIAQIDATAAAQAVKAAA